MNIMGGKSRWREREGMHVHFEGVKLCRVTVWKTKLQGNGSRKLRWLLWIMKTFVFVLTLQSWPLCNAQTFNSSHAATIRMCVHCRALKIQNSSILGSSRNINSSITEGLTNKGYVQSFMAECILEVWDSILHLVTGCLDRFCVVFLSTSRYVWIVL